MRCAFIKERNIYYPPKEPADGEGGHKEADEVGKQCCRDGVAGFLDTGGAEVDADGVEGGFRRAEHDGGGAADGGIYTVAAHQLRPHCQGGAAAEGPDEHQQGRLRGDTEEGEYRRCPAAQLLRRPGGAEHGHGTEQHNQ